MEPQEYQLFINGEWVPSATGTLADDLNPATGAVYARVHQAAKQDIEAAIATAYAAREAWGTSPPGFRERILLKAADLLEERTAAFADVLIDEGGSTFGKAMFEIGAVVDVLRSAAGECRRIFGETIPSDSPGVISLTVRRPLGVIAGIAPFNFPLVLAMNKVCLALAAGNTFVLKPASPTPVIGLKIAELFEAAGLPAGVLNVIPVKGSTLGDTLVSDPRIRMVTFTGSTEVGKQLAEVAGRHQKKITLEMGGKSPLIVLKDADLDYAVDAAVFGIFLHQGQVCMVNSRLIVEAEVYEAFCDKLVAKTRTLKIGNPHQPDTVVGPLVEAKQCPFIKGQIDEAVAAGARLLQGGSYAGGYFQPTIVADVGANTRLFQEESFGPVVCVVRATDSEEALALANNSAFGLSSGIITNDLQKAMDLALRLEAGMVHVNDCTISAEPHIPFGGVKESGVGREGGHYSIEEMTEIKWITIQLGKRQFPF